MIEFIKNYFNYSDSRGAIKGIINEGSWQEINQISSKSGAIRGDHFHKETKELFIILDGEIDISLQRVKNNKKTGLVKQLVVKAGDVFLIEPFILHTFTIVKDAKWLNVLSKRIETDNPDIFRLS